MQQHPIPQNVTQYQFRLVGDMTLKQFLELAGGMVVAYLFFASNLLFFIKWPLALGSLLLGIGLAFFPIEERPLDVWIINFLKSIYAPTRFTWQKTTKLPALFTFKAHDIVERKTSTKTIKAPVLPISTTPTTDYSDEEATKIKTLESILTQLEPTAKKIQPKTKNQELITKNQKPTISIRKLSPDNLVFQAKPVKTKPTKKDLKIPPTPNQAGDAKRLDNLAPTADTPIRRHADTPIYRQTDTPTPAETIKLPASPKKPNIVVGMVVNKKGKIVSGAIVEIITENGIPARAIKTNSLGQFYISTPLAPGNYIIEIDAEGLTFPNQSLLIKDKLISPIILRAS